MTPSQKEAREAHAELAALNAVAIAAKCYMLLADQSPTYGEQLQAALATLEAVRSAKGQARDSEIVSDNPA